MTRGRQAEVGRQAEAGRRATRGRRLGTGGALAALVAAGLATAGTPAHATTGFNLQRLSGQLRWETAAAIATAAFPDGSDTAVLANGMPGGYADALVANYLAGQLHAPVLLTTATKTRAETVKALTDLKVKSVWIVGGPAVVSPEQEAALKAAGYVVHRLGGLDRYETAQAVNEHTGPPVGLVDGKRTALVATGQAFADAVSAGPLAYADHLPLVLTRSQSLTPQASATLKDLGIEQVVIVGGTGAVSQGVEDAIVAQGISVAHRAAGDDRSQTSTDLAAWAIAHAGFSSDGVSVASGEPTLGGADALAGGPLAGEHKIPVLLTRTASNPGDTTAYTAAHKAALTFGYVYGDGGAVASAVETAIEKAGGFGVAAPTYSMTGGGTVTISTDSSPSSGHVEYVVTGLGTEPVDLQLFASANVSYDGSTPLFDQTAGRAAPGTAVGSIVSVNGSAASGDHVYGVVPVDGKITFTVNSTVAGADVPVVFGRADGDDLLQVAANGAPIDAFGVGPVADWTAVPAAAGTYTGLVVTRVHASASTFEAKAPSGATVDANGLAAGEVRTFAFGSDDTFGDAIKPSIPLAQFRAELGAGDTISTTYAGSGSSTFSIDRDVPAPPTNVTAKYDAAGKRVVVSWTASPNLDVDEYDLFAYRVVAGVVSRQTMTVGAVYGTTGARLEASPGTYVYWVVARDGLECNPVTECGGRSAPSAQTVPVTVPGAGNAAAPWITKTVISDAGGRDGVLDAGDTITYTMSEPVRLGGGSFTLVDGDGTVSTVTRGDNVVMSLNDNGTEVHVYLVAPPRVSKAGSVGGTNAGTGRQTVVNSAGITDLAGLPLAEVTATVTGTDSGTTVTMRFNAPIERSTVTSSDFFPGTPTVVWSGGNRVATLTYSPHLGLNAAGGLRAQSVRNVYGGNGPARDAVFIVPAP